MKSLFFIFVLIYVFDNICYNLYWKRDENMAKQVVYHGSYCKIEKPKIKIGKFHKDFGDGFYCTILSEQAIRWAKKFETSILNIYEYIENPSLRIKEFNVMSEEWLDFIINSRAGVKHQFDIVIGAMADDQIYNYVSDLIDGVITREAFWELAKFRHPTHQIAFCTNKSLETLSFLEAKDVD